MTHADFVAEGYYFNGGMQLIQPGSVIKHAEAGGEQYYMLVYNEPDDEVYLLQNGSEEPVELQDGETLRGFFRDCYPVSKQEQDALGLTFPEE